MALKTILLLALVSAKGISEVHTFSVYSACTQFVSRHLRVSLRPNPCFCAQSGQFILSCGAGCLVPAAVLSRGTALIYVMFGLCIIHLDGQDKGFQKVNSCLGLMLNLVGKLVTKQKLSHLIVGAMALAYTNRGMQAPAVLHAHSTRGMATSWALFRGVYP